MTEYNLASESVNLFQLHETATHNRINQKNRQVNEWITRMEKLEKFLTLVAQRTEDSNRFDMTSAEDQALIDELRDIEELEHIFPHGQYVWKEKELEHMTEKVNQYIQGPLQRKIGVGSEEIVLIQHELTKALELFKNGLSRMNNLVERISSNIQRAH